jgi:hypothetical protein
MRKELKIKIIEKFDNQTNFARVCGKTENWISRIIQNRQTPTDVERSLMVKVLKCDPQEIFPDDNE